MSREADAIKMKHFSEFEANFYSWGNTISLVFTSDSNENQCWNIAFSTGDRNSVSLTSSCCQINVSFANCS